MVNPTWAGLSVTVFHCLAAAGVLTAAAAMFPLSTLLPPSFGLPQLQMGLEVESLVVLGIATAGLAVGALPRPPHQLVPIGAALTLAIPWTVEPRIPFPFVGSTWAERSAVASSMLVIFGAMLVFAATLHAAARSVSLRHWRSGAALLVVVIGAPTAGSIMAGTLDPAPSVWAGLAGFGVLCAAGAYRAASGSWLGSGDRRADRTAEPALEAGRLADEDGPQSEADQGHPAVTADGPPSAALRNRLAQGAFLIPLLAVVVGWLISPVGITSWAFATIVLIGATGVAICWSAVASSLTGFLTAALTLAAGSILLFRDAAVSTAGIPAEWPLVLFGLGALVAGAMATAKAETRRRVDPRAWLGMLLCLGVAVASLISLADLATRPEPVEIETMRGIEMSEMYGSSAEEIFGPGSGLPREPRHFDPRIELPEPSPILAVVLIVAASGTLLVLALLRSRARPRSHAEPEAG